MKPKYPRCILLFRKLYFFFLESRLEDPTRGGERPVAPSLLPLQSQPSVTKSDLSRTDSKDHLAQTNVMEHLAQTDTMEHQYESGPENDNEEKPLLGTDHEPSLQF